MIFLTPKYKVKIMKPGQFIKFIIFLVFILIAWQNFAQAANKQCRQSFTADLALLDVSPLLRSHEYQTLKKQGFRDSFIVGIDEINILLHLGKRLKETPNINPSATHIEPFARLAPKHINFLKEGILGQKEKIVKNDPQDLDSQKKDSLAGRFIQEKLQILDLLEQEARQKGQTKAVTYKWWLFWNYRLAVLANAMPSSKTTDLKKYEHWLFSDKELNKHLDNSTKKNPEVFRVLLDSVHKFPKNILLPTTQKLGIMALNKIGASGIIPIGLTTEDMPVDGRILPPLKFFTHDVLHFESGFGKERSHKPPEISHQQFHLMFRDIVKDWSKEKRERAEIAYFLIAHEWSVGVTMGATILRGMANITRFQKKNDLGLFLPKEVNRNSSSEVKIYLQKIKETFEEIMTEMQNRLEDIERKPKTPLALSTGVRH